MKVKTDGISTYALATARCRKPLYLPEGSLQIRSLFQALHADH